MRKLARKIAAASCIGWQWWWRWCPWEQRRRVEVLWVGNGGVEAVGMVRRRAVLGCEGLGMAHMVVSMYGGDLHVEILQARASWRW